MKRILFVAFSLTLTVMALSLPGAAQQVSGCGCYCGKVLRPPCSDNACKQACGWTGGSSGGSSSNYNAAAAAAAAEAEAEAEREREAAAEAERKRQEEELRRQEEERQKREAEERQRQREEFERNKAQALRDLKGISGELGLKGTDTDDFGLKGVGDAGLGLKNPTDTTTSPPAATAKPAWVAQITDPQVARYARSIDSIVVPPPVPAKEVPLDWKQIYLSDESLMKSADRLMAFWEMTGPLGSAVDKPLKVIMIAGKTFIAGEDGAALYLVKKDQLYDQALGYLKTPAQSQQFARLVQAIRENHPLPANADPAMVAAARAIADPKLARGSATIAWDAMISSDALSAMLRKASIEIGSDYLSDKAGELLTDEHERKAVFDSLRLERRQAVNMLERGSPTAAQSEQLKTVIDHANQTMAQIYRVEKVADSARGEVIGQATDKLATALLGPAAGESEEK